MVLRMEVDSLLSAPSAGGEDFTKPLRRKGCAYKSKCERYKVADREYTRQYSHLYFVRLCKMKPLLKQRAEEMWGEELACSLNKYRVWGD